MTEHVWVAVAVVFPLLCAAYTFDKILAARGPEAFQNPGGWRLPFGEVALLAAALGGLAFVAVVGTA